MKSALFTKHNFSFCKQLMTSFQRKAHFHCWHGCSLGVVLDTLAKAVSIKWYTFFYCTAAFSYITIIGMSYAEFSRLAPTETVAFKLIFSATMFQQTITPHFQATAVSIGTTLVIILPCAWFWYMIDEASHVFCALGPTVIFSPGSKKNRGTYIQYI